MIDSHTHIYPDKIAAKVAATVKDAFPLAGDFTLKDIKSYMKRCEIEAIVTFCVAERREVVAAANNFLIEINDNQTIFGFGTILPDVKDPVEEVKRINAQGIKGIKFHSIFQPIRGGDENLFPIYEAMAKAGMIAYFHVGKDPIHPSQPPGTGPRDIAHLKERFPALKIVAAHFGGLFMLDEARKWIIGKDIYIDTCWGPNIQSLEQNEVIDLIRKHGAEKVLFATDYPSTTDPLPQIKWWKDLPLPEKEKQLIFRENARRLLGL
ncbi:MAG TPA: amidohydrolase family protein [Thermodesulfobacteriota bacterium]|nr:amidohydrolase family protein [Thermodesulfobacteriota bacterium]